MTAKTAPIQTLSTMLIVRWEQAGRKLAELAQAFPENRYDESPVQGIRSFADVVRHVAFWNQYLADTARGKKADETANELPRKSCPTKDKIIAALQRATAEATAALRAHQGGLPPATAEVLVTMTEHSCEHYGQLVAYARLNGVVPPASR